MSRNSENKMERKERQVGNKMKRKTNIDERKVAPHRLIGLASLSSVLIHKINESRH